MKSVIFTNLTPSLHNRANSSPCSRLGHQFSPGRHRPPYLIDVNAHDKHAPTTNPHVPVGRRRRDQTNKAIMLTLIIRFGIWRFALNALNASRNNRRLIERRLVRETLCVGLVLDGLRNGSKFSAGSPSVPNIRRIRHVRNMEKLIKWQAAKRALSTRLFSWVQWMESKWRLVFFSWGLLLPLWSPRQKLFENYTWNSIIN